MIEKHTLKNYRVRIIGRLESVRMQYYAISPERKITNAAVTLIVDQAQRAVFDENLRFRRGRGSKRSKRPAGKSF
jgi:hypothetical protein